MSEHGNIPSLSTKLRHIALLLEAIVAELRCIRGLGEQDAPFLAERGADYFVPLEKLQEQRRDLFT
jgi:hypothetical protein